MTDRQPTTMRAACWSCTAFDNDEIVLLENSDNYPQFVKQVYGGREICPTTNREHFQGAIVLKTQQRLSAMKKWLPTAHFQVARQTEALKKYCMKQETAVGPKLVRNNERKYLTMKDALMTLARTLLDDNDVVKDMTISQKYWYAVRKHLIDFPDDIGLFSQPQMLRAFKNTASVWELHNLIDGVN